MSNPINTPVQTEKKNESSTAVKPLEVENQNIKSSSTPAEAKKTTVTPADNKKDIENHKMVAGHLEQAAKHHHEAAKHHEDGNHEKAAESTVKAQGNHSLASDAQRNDVKNHALNN